MSEGRNLGGAWRLVMGVTGRLAAALALGLAAMGGCDGGPGPATSSPSPLAGCVRPTGSAADAGSALVPGPSIGLTRSTAVGEPLVIEAVMLDRACRPAEGAVVNLWHTDARGLYGPKGSEKCCYYRGQVRTDHNGRFRLQSIRPAQYPEPNAPPAHIHLEIRHPSGNLDTEIVFDTAPPSSIAPPTGGLLPITLRREGAEWRGDAVFVFG